MRNNTITLIVILLILALAGVFGAAAIVFSWAFPEIWMVPVPDYSISFK